MEGKDCVNALFDNATDSILIVNEKGEIARMNPSAEKLFGYKQREIEGKLIEVLIPQRFRNNHIVHRNEHLQDPIQHAMQLGKDFYGLKKDGTEFPAQVNLNSHSDADGKYTLAFFVDMTYRKEAEERMKNYSTAMELQVKNRTMILESAIEELEKTKKDLKVSLEKEKELNGLKSRFVSMASHEFRTPLATIKSSLSLVRKYGKILDTEKQERHFNKIKSSINNLTDILNDFLSVSKLEEGKVEKVSEEFNLNAFLSDIISDMQAITKEGQKITYSHSGNDTVNLDKKFLKNILINLTSNAIKFSRDGQTIKINSEASLRSVKILVRDSGIGIPEDDQKHLFERFFRGQNATHLQGTGLGLNIVAKYVELMNGSIDVTSKENKGTTFIISLPQ